jgi:hypothetical protein
MIAWVELARPRKTDEPQMDQASCEAMAGKLQIYGDGVATAELLLMKYQSPDEHELAPTVHPFASLREIFIRVHSCPFAFFFAAIDFTSASSASSARGSFFLFLKQYGSSC